MFTGNISPISNRADWIDAFQLLDTETGDAIDISDATEIEVIIRKQISKDELLSVSLAGGGIEHIETGVFQWTFSASQLRDLCAETYEVVARIVKDEIASTLMVAALPVIEG